MGKDTEFISEAIHQRDFFRITDTALNLTTLIHSSSIYILFVTCSLMLGFIFSLLLLQGVRLQCQQDKFLLFLCTFFFFFCNNVTPIFPSPNFLLLTCVLILSKDKHAFSPLPPPTHKHFLLTVQLQTPRFERGWLLTPVSREARQMMGNLSADKSVYDGPTLCPTSCCLSWALKLLWDDGTHTGKAVMLMSWWHTLRCYLFAL